MDSDEAESFDAALEALDLWGSRYGREDSSGPCDLVCSIGEYLRAYAFSGNLPPWYDSARLHAQDTPVMHVGIACLFQNSGKKLSDYEVYRNEVRLADLAEPLGYESVWASEHHFTGYIMCPNALQFLSYMAGRTEKIKLGSMVVLPWHDPLRVAEGLVMLDNLSDGRVIVGVERGLAQVEYEGFRVDMGESRGRFIESARMLVNALENNNAVSDGEHIKQPAVEIRPNSFRSFRGRAYAAAISPESSVVLAILGLGMMIIPQRPWDEIQAALATYRSTYREANKEEPPAPVVATFVYCDEDEERAAHISRRYIGSHWESVIQHFDLRGDYLRMAGGYEYYASLSDDINAYGRNALQDFFVSLQVAGTPEQCLQKIMDINGYTGANSLVAFFSYGGMPYGDAERSMRLFASEVMPALKKFGPAPAWG